ncbi:MAG TPA: YkoF family thiamine/hydroxymethylpyrimidine-binding protein [Bacteroidales bacterium]|nr:YkoF family thiamine/hydroxymethylpyrimidine-binding protein [Bacteroidales bacterium]HPS18486.1 YkoF family thiamine/hydroxymethylpyrimidine-binding protein [Bacteroidales bacterium]
MKASVEISYYPLNQEFIPHIKDFIDRINKYPELVVRTNTMSTQIFGEYKEIMNALTNEIEKSFELPHSVFVMKIINADLEK